MVARFVSLLLLRHGQSEWHQRRRWQGLAESSLNELARRHAEHAAAALGCTDERLPSPGGAWISVDVSATGTVVGVDLRRRFDPSRIVRTGVDTPGENPGEQPDSSETHRDTDR